MFRIRSIGFNLCFVAGALAATLVLCGLRTASGDWPQWRHDANRSGASDEAIARKPALLWTRDLGPPDPAYDHQYRMCADASYAPVAAGGRLFVPSNRCDSVTAYDLRTGELLWRYVTEGPVRMAPIADGDRLIFGSDDGHLYCVHVGDGTLRWRRRGAPEENPDSRMLVNGRLASRWPVRGAPVLHEGVVYYGCGLWPEEGVYVGAVAAESGAVLWRNQRLSYLKDGMSDHGRVYDLGLPPQGYLAVIDGKLAVPSGRALAAWFDIHSGAMEPYSCFYVKLNPPRGTWRVAGIGPYAVQGGNWFSTSPGTLPPLPPGLKESRTGVVGSRSRPRHELAAAANRPLINTMKYALHNENLYPDLVLTETTAYASEFNTPGEYLVPRGHTRVSYPAKDRIVARDLTRPQWRRVPESIHHYPKGTTIRRLEFPVRWELKTPLRVLIKAGDRLICGEENAVAAIAVPEAGESPSVAWRGPIQGNPVGALAASGCLVITTDVGKLYCFGEAEEPARTWNMPVLASPGVPDGGYALCVGRTAERRARTLAEPGGYRVVLLARDGEKAAAIRQSLAAEGLPADRVQAIGNVATLRLTPYWANRVVLGSLDDWGSAADRTLRSALDAMRPLTGRMELLDGFDDVKALQSAVAATADCRFDARGRGRAVVRNARPPGSAHWSHEAGSPQNAFSSADERVRWPLATLWYSGEIDRHFTPATHFQHERNPYPLVTRGRMFVITHEHLHAVDIYTGRYLWQAEMPKTPQVEARYEDSRIYGRPVDRNCIATDEAVYVVLEEAIHVYAAVDGSKQAVIGFPEVAPRGTFRLRWTEVRIDGDILYAVLGRTLVALNRRTGELLWRRASTQEATTYTIGDGKIFGLDYVGTKVGGRRRPATVQGLMFCLDTGSGKPLWSRQVQYDSVPEHKVDHPRPWLLPPNPELIYNARHGLIVLAARRNSVRVFRAIDGGFVWEKSGLSGNVQRTYTPVVTDDYLVLSGFQGFFGYVLDVRTGRPLEEAGIPRPRTCARIIGNNHLLVYRDAATELYDLPARRMIGLNSVRSGCTTSFIPAGGILTAPMLGHGCVCNYPMFASLAMYPTHDFEPYRPKRVVASWENEAAGTEIVGGVAVPRRPRFPKDLRDANVDVARYTPANATLKKAERGLLFSTADDTVGYALRPVEKPVRKASFRCAVRRASGPGRHGNGFLVLSPEGNPEKLIECRLYYGGRSSLMITGPGVERAEKRAEFQRGGVYTIRVDIDCPAGVVSFEAAGQKLTAKMNKPWPAVAAYGYGGGNSDNLFTGIRVDTQESRR